MGDLLGARKFRILVIEDNEADVKLLRLALDGAGLQYDLAVIQDGGEAMEYVRRHAGGAETDRAPNLIVLDLNVPKNDGLEILSAMREARVFEHVPVLVLTSSSSPRERGKLEALGIAKHVRKPLEYDEFMRIGPVVKQVLSGADGLAAEQAAR